MSLKDRSYLKLAVLDKAPPAIAPITTSSSTSQPQGSIDHFPLISTRMLKGLEPKQLARVREAQAAKKEIWEELLELYRERIGNADRETFAKLVDQTYIYRSSMVQVENVGTVTLSPRSYPMHNPYLAIANKAEGRILKYMIQLGLTPMSRGRVKSSKAGKGRSNNAFGSLRRLDE